MADDAIPTEPSAPTDATTAPAEDATPPSVAGPTPSNQDEVTTKLNELGIDAAVADALGVTSLDDFSLLTQEDFVAAGVKPVAARKLLAEFSPATTAVDDAAVTSAALNLLPRPMDNSSWTAALKTSGVLKVGEVAYTSAVRAAIASSVDLFGIPQRVVDLMEEFSQVAEEPFTEEYYTLRDQVIRMDYGDLFNAIPGITKQYVTKSRKDELIKRIKQYLWPSLRDFNDQVVSWNDKYLQTALDPRLMQAAILRGPQGLPAGLMQAPDTSPLRDYSEEVTNTINKVFAGDGPIVASAMAVEANQIRDMLTNPALPAATGTTSRELMLKKLGVDIGPADTRLEQDVTTFVLATVQLKDQSSEAEIGYIGALYQLGLQIPWDKLGADSGFSTVGGGRRKL